MDWTGLAAQAWDPSGGDSLQPDYYYILKLLERNAGPALDVGCGTGRLLLRYLKAGFDVDGIDSAADMLAICREKAKRQGLTPILYHQPMQRLEIPRHYATIFIPCGTFCLVTDREEVWETLRRLYTRLEPHGLLIFNLFWPFSDGEPLSAKPPGGDKDWGLLWKHPQPEGGEIVQSFKRAAIDRVEQLLIGQRRYQWMEEGRIIKEEIFDTRERWYYKYEMQLMLEKAGFGDIQAKGNWTDEEFSEAHSTIVWLARKP